MIINFSCVNIYLSYTHYVLLIYQLYACVFKAGVGDVKIGLGDPSIQGGQPYQEQAIDEDDDHGNCCTRHVGSVQNTLSTWYQNNKVRARIISDIKRKPLEMMRVTK